MMTTDSRLVLVVEDSETQALRLGALLDDEQIANDRAASAEEALDYLGRSRPDLILVDYHLPGMRGDELCRQIRMNPTNNDVLVLMLTGDTEGEVERLGLDSGADDYAPKSTDPDALMARIHALLRSRPQSMFASGNKAGRFRQRPRVVAVDDSLTFLEYLRHELDREGYEIATFEGGEAAIDHIAKTRCDCMLVDLVMPGIDGIEMCRRLDHIRRRGGAWFPLLIITGKDTKDDMMRALEAGADDFVTKSSDVAILRARIRALLRRKAQRDEHDRISNEFRLKELEVVRERSEREAAERRAALAEQLETANAELKQTQAQLVQAAKMASLGELVAGIAHEINNPLAYITSHVDTVERSLKTLVGGIEARLSNVELKQLEKAKTRLIDIRGGLSRVADLVEKLRTFARLDQGEFKQCDIRENVQAVMTILQHRLEGRMTVRTGFVDDNTIWCYPAPLNQVIMNLVSNAIDAVDRDGMIEVRTRRNDSEFLIAVADNGKGVDPAVRERIFEPFFTSKPVGKGVGLGLAIAYRIIQTHHGRIDVRDRQGGGAEFVVAIPLDLKEKYDERRGKVGPDASYRR